MTHTSRVSLAISLVTAVAATGWAFVAAVENQLPGASYAVIVKKSTFEDAQWGKVVAALQTKHDARVITYETSVDESLDVLKRQFPRYTCFVARPTEATGDFFQISNQTTLGRSEHQIIEDFSTRTIPHIIDYERRARRVLLKEQTIAIDDKARRALAVLHAAKLISSEETMYLLSPVRLGIHLGRCNKMDIAAVNELFLRTQPAHLQKMHNRAMEPRERAEARATYIHKRLDAV